MSCALCVLVSERTIDFWLNCCSPFCVTIVKPNLRRGEVPSTHYCSYKVHKCIVKTLDGTRIAHFFCHGNEASKISCVTDNVLTDSLQGSDLFHWFVIQFSSYRVLLLIQNRKGYKVGGNCKQSVGRKMQIFLSVGCRSTDLLDCLGLVKVGQIC